MSPEVDAADADGRSCTRGGPARAGLEAGRGLVLGGEDPSQAVDYTLNKHWLISGYFGDAQGGAIMRTIYPAGYNARFAYAELTFTY